MENLQFSFKKILGNSFWPIAQNIINLLVSAVVTGIVARYLGPENYGIVNYAISVVMLFTSFSTLGMDTIVVKDLVDNKKESSKILGTSFLIRLIGSFVLIILSQITLLVLSNGDKTILKIGMIMGLCMTFKSFEVIEYYLQSVMKLKVSSIIRFITMLVVSVFKILVVVFNLGIIGYALSYLIDSIAAGILFYIYYKLKNRDKWKFNTSYAKSILSRCWYVALSGLMVTIYMRIDQVMLGSMLDSKIQNGIYSAAVKVAEMWYFIPLAVISSFQPIIMNNKKKSEEEYIKLMQRLYDLIAIIGIICGIGITIFSRLIVNILYGNEYIGATRILTISVWAGLFATLGSARSVWLITEGLQKYTLSYTLVGCILNISLNYILIPIYGAFGAAIATLMSQMISNVFVLLLFKKTRISSIMILKSIFKNNLLKDTFITIKKKLSNNKKIA